MKSDLVEIKTDLKWIKQNLQDFSSQNQKEHEDIRDRVEGTIIDTTKLKTEVAIFGAAAGGVASLIAGYLFK